MIFQILVMSLKLSGKFFDNAFLLQERDNIVFNKKKLRCVTKNKPSSKELKDIEFALKYASTLSLTL